MQTRRNQDYVLIASKSVIFLHLLFYCVSVTPHSFVNFPFLMHFSLFLEKKKKPANNVCIVELTSSNSAHSL